MSSRTYRARPDDARPSDVARGRTAFEPGGSRGPLPWSPAVKAGGWVFASGFAVTSGAGDIDSTPPPRRRGRRHRRSLRAPHRRSPTAPKHRDGSRSHPRSTRAAPRAARQCALRRGCPRPPGSRSRARRPRSPRREHRRARPPRGSRQRPDRRGACLRGRRRTARPASAPPTGSPRGSCHYAAGRCSRSMTSRQNAAARAPSTTRWSNVNETFPTGRTTISPSRTTGRSAMRWMPRMPTSG